MSVVKSLLIGLFFISVASLYAAPPAATLKQQFEELKEGSNSYQDYKVVKETRLNAFWHTVADTLAQYQQQVAANRKQISELSQEVAVVKGQLNEQQSQVSSLEHDKARITFLGMDLLKNTYTTVVWLLIGTLFVTLLTLLYRFRISHRITAGTQRDHAHLQEEFEEFRKRAHEREVRIKRELQTERNRVEEIKQKLPIYK